jgi:hypothetical protein
MHATVGRRLVPTPLVLALLAGAAAGGPGAAGQKKGPQVTEKEFRQANFQLLEDPLADKARDYAKAVIVFAAQTPDAEVTLGKRELKWVGGKEDKRGMLLLAAYAGGNTLSQLNSGVKRDDPYAGLLQVFRVYRALRRRDKDFRNDEVDRLLGLHRQGRLLLHLEEDREKPAKEAK